MFVAFKIFPQSRILRAVFFMINENEKQLEGKDNYKLNLAI